MIRPSQRSSSVFELNSLPKTIKAAREIGVDRYFTGKKCLRSKGIRHQSFTDKCIISKEK